MGDLVQRRKAQGRITPPEPITETHELDGFDCSKPLLNEWLVKHALRNEGRSSRTYVICDIDRRVIGYYVLATGSVSHDNAPRALKANLPNPTPVLVMGRLAVDKNYHKRGIGADLLRDGLCRALNVSLSIGALALIVHAKDDDVVPFYASYGFKSYPDDSRRMFITMKDIAAAL